MLQMYFHYISTWLSNLHDYHHVYALVAYHTLKECAQQKGVLTEKIQTTNKKIKAKLQAAGESQRRTEGSIARYVDYTILCEFIIIFSLSLSLSLSP